MNKKLLVLINIIGIFLAWFAVEKIIYFDAEKSFKKQYTDRNPDKFRYLKKPIYGVNLATHYNGENNEFAGRTPDGLEYKTTPFVVFGCSYAYGQFLNPNQTFSYKLAHAIKHPVYNRAIPGKGLAKMLYQSESEVFYKDVPKSDTIIYIMLDDHYRRMKLSFLEITDAYIHVTYKKEGNKLIKEDFSNPIKCLLHSTYISKFINRKYVHNYVENPKYAEKLTDEALLYFIETRNNLEKHWNTKINFVVIFYNHWLRNADMLKEKLEKNNFTVIETKELTNENLFSDKYYSPKTLHPTEATWDLLTPLIIKELGL